MLAKPLLVPWTNSEGELLKALREAERIEESVFASSATISRAQLLELENGATGLKGHFYSPAMKAQIGRKLLRKLGHVSAPPLARVTESAFIAPIESAANVVPVLPDPQSAQGLKAFMGLGLALLVSGAVFTLWQTSSAPAQPEAFKLASLPQPLATAPDGPVAQPATVPVPALASPQSEPLMPALAASVGPQNGGAQTVAAPPSAVPLCAAQLRTNSQIFTPKAPTKTGGYVYLVASQSVTACVLDQENNLAVLTLEAGQARSVYGKPPFLVGSERLQDLQLFFQSRRVGAVPEGSKHIVLVAASVVPDKLPE